MVNSINGMEERFPARLGQKETKILLYSTPALYVTAHALRRFMPALRAARDLKTISEVSEGFDEFQKFIEKSYRERKYLR